MCPRPAQRPASLSLGTGVRFAPTRQPPQQRVHVERGLRVRRVRGERRTFTCQAQPRACSWCSSARQNSDARTGAAHFAFLRSLREASAQRARVDAPEVPGAAPSACCGAHSAAACASAWLWREQWTEGRRRALAQTRAVEQSEWSEQCGVSVGTRTAGRTAPASYAGRLRAPRAASPDPPCFWI